MPKSTGGGAQQRMPRLRHGRMHPTAQEAPITAREVMIMAREITGTTLAVMILTALVTRIAVALGATITAALEATITA